MSICGHDTRDFDQTVTAAGAAGFKGGGEGKGGTSRHPGRAAPLRAGAVAAAARGQACS